ncbi:SDR family oxidoreductase [Jannaschia sp. Os4]|uniref:SDR family oxidoreductase n=1 Tax=Jannaschia sp. Os4 TaxID=2807617 RepID=UPI00193AA009|nr:SDR family oxidoreductase [Jannaschia sp. Os4]MBM2576703.1 SDR family oxidoreductase [Jannaschia sp. Os4]
MDQKPPALVTGASRGLGAAMAETLARRGWHVVAVARTTGGLEALDDRIQAAGGSATLAPMDVTVDAAMQQLCRGIHDRWGALPVWVHCAVEATALSPADMIPAKDFGKALETNVTAFVRLVSYVSPLLRAAGGGDAVFLDDEGARKFGAAYGATKAAQREIVRAWQAEATTATAPRVHLLRPAPMATAVRARFFPGEDTSGLADAREEAARLLDEAGLARAG